ncbi:enoyl-CoA hydratase/isomerase family protein [Aurantiacibacter sediminis]|uniref:Enoyl-CoA hydratase/isomerase family protein n=1 Tax=Aurantiacibacter sediminis TaxID=2793064 RepID=A0ABS0N6Q0_9SPHN|nr:enoyl-CoA hydratase/isomerase family protein [Aurantiacibacter sediminis]MBH5323471.1 enoyl-CoA hydratase/isomerase family protein [Aurantiacibacter sediminis]
MSGHGIVGIHEGGVAHLTIDRAEQKNTLGPDQFAALLDLVRAADANDDVRVVLLTAAGKHFSTGADTRAKWPVAEAAIVEEGHAERQALMQCSKPVVVAAQGAIIGAGAELALTADIILMGEGAFFSFPEMRMNTLTLAGTIGRLVSLVGRFAAAEIVASGRKVGADEAMRIGLVSRAVADENLADAAHELATVLASKPSALSADFKALLRDADMANAIERLDAERAASARAFSAMMAAMGG